MEFNWRTRTYGLSEDEVRRGGSVVYCRRVRVPGWVYWGRVLGFDWGEVWVERG